MTFQLVRDVEPCPLVLRLVPLKVSNPFWCELGVLGQLHIKKKFPSGGHPTRGNKGWGGGGEEDEGVRRDKSAESARGRLLLPGLG